MNALAAALVASMRACIRWPAVFDPLKAAWLLAALALLKLRGLGAHAPGIAADYGFVLAGAPTASILNRIVLYRGAFEPTLSDVVMEQVRPGDACLDLGANAGYFALLMGLRSGAGGSVVAVEASPGTVGKLRANVAANAFEDRVRVVHAACVDRDGDVTFHVSRDNDMHCRLELPAPGGPFAWLLRRERWRPVVVRGLALPAILQEARVDPAAIRFAKVDLEGAEPLVLPQLLAHCTHPELMVAAETQAPNIRAVLEPFERAGFHAYDLRNDYRWLLNAGAPRPAACSFGELYARRGLVDVLLSRVPLAYPPAGA